MEPILKSEIFFFITSISVIIITVVLIISGTYFINIMKNLSNISDKLKKAADNTESNIEEISERVKESPIFTFIFGKKKTKKTKAK